MTKQEYLSIRDDQTANTIPYFYFFFTLRGGNVIGEPKFGELFHLWLMKNNYMRHLAKLHMFVEAELNKHFNV